MTDAADHNATAPFVRITRTVPGPPEAAFDAWVVPEIRKRWWAAAENMYCDLCEIDARPDGAYRINMKSEAGKQYICYGRFTAYDRPNRLAFTWNWEHEEMPDSLVTITFEATPEGTRITLVHEGLPTRKLADEHEGGWTGCLNQLVRLLGSAD